MKPLLSRANLLIAKDIEWANTLFAFEQREQESEHVVSTVQTCMKEYGLTVEQANEKLQRIIEESWMDISEEYLKKHVTKQRYHTAGDGVVGFCHVMVIGVIVLFNHVFIPLRYLFKCR